MQTKKILSFWEKKSIGIAKTILGLYVILVFLFSNVGFVLLVQGEEGSEKEAEDKEVEKEVENKVEDVSDGE